MVTMLAERLAEKREHKVKLNHIYCGDVLEVLRTFPDECVDCVVASPPYWGLRNYGEETNKIWGGDKNCEHRWEGNIKCPTKIGVQGSTETIKNPSLVKSMRKPKGSSFCKKCGAWYGQLGLEPTLDLYIEHLLEVMRELKRVLKKTGVIFWNHGDCYFGGHPCGSIHGKITGSRYKDKGVIPQQKEGRPQGQSIYRKIEKCLVLQNYRFILRCVDELGLILRNVIIWHKPNHMPSSVKDRFTNAYEPVFMLTKSKKYWFDLDAVRKPYTEPLNRWGGEELKPKPVRCPRCLGIGRIPIESLNPQKCPDCNGKGIIYKKSAWDKETNQQTYRNRDMRPNKAGKNPADVWQIPTQPFPEAHFATFPERLVEPMIKAGCPQWICKKCGKARVGITNKDYVPTRPGRKVGTGKSGTNIDPNKSLHQRDISKYRMKIEYQTIGFTDCNCNAGWKSGVVLDPFLGSGTTAVVAKKLGRNYVGIELNPKYVKMAEKRIANTEGRLL